MIIAVLDACVIYPPALRDILMWQVVVGTYQPRWSEEIHSEWMRNVLKNRPDVSAEQLERTRRLMDQIHPKCLVSGYENRIPELELPDENDRHVLAAAIQTGATALVTFNLTDFPRSILLPFGIRALTPDAFLEGIFKTNPLLFLSGIRRHRASLKNPPKSPEAYIESLRTHDLKRTAKFLEFQIENI